MVAKSKKILIAEDDPILIKVLGTVLEDKGFAVDRVSNGKEALNKILHRAYALVLLDLVMPQMSGIEVLRGIKKAKNKTPVLVFSNLSHDINKSEVLNLGAKGYYVKSGMSIKEVVKTVKDFLQKDNHHKK